ncbi:MAG: hypothetical protein KJ601_05455 [Nanoarchaeota archaeon]|nr:hypothetical protein [Nanoarchaeota archaeon]MBU1704360.1 hypothetical protein [Nanoarchaeota archaeon]
MKRLLWLIIVVLFASYSYAVECGTVPTDGCILSTDTTFTPGTYNLPNGIKIRTSGVDLDCNGATIQGSGGGSGITIDNSQYFYGPDSWSIKNCNIEDYGHGITISNPYICCYSESGEIKYGLIQDNNFRDNYYGIYATGSPGYQMWVQNNQILGNTFDGNIYGVYFPDSAVFSNTIADNDFYDSGIYYKYTGNSYCYNGVANRYHNTSGPSCSCQVPINDMYIRHSTTFCPGDYNLASGVSIIASGVDLNCNGAKIIGSGSGSGVRITNVEELYGPDSWTVRDCGISNYNMGVQVNNDYICCYSDMRDNSYGNIIDNDISNNYYGIYAIGDPGEFMDVEYMNVDSNTIHNNQIGIQYQDSIVSSTVNNSDFYGNSNRNIKNLQGSGVNGENNWWGSANETIIKYMITDCLDGGYGCVDYTPWLTVGPEDRMTDLMINGTTIRLTNISIKVVNDGSYAVRNLKINLMDIIDGELVNNETFNVGSFAPFESRTVVVNFATGHEVVIVLDPDNEVIERNKENNVYIGSYEKSIKLFIDTDVPPTVADEEIRQYVLAGLSPYEIVPEEEAEVLVYIARHNPVVVWNFEAEKEEGWVYYGNFLVKAGEIDDAPYSGLVGSFDRDGQRYIGIMGNDVDGFIVGAKEFVNNLDMYLNVDTASLFGKHYVNGVAVYDYLHSDDLKKDYKKNNEEFRLAVRNALSGRYAGVTEFNITVNNTLYRLKRISAALSDDYKQVVNPDQYPVVMGGGLWSDIDAWYELGDELANSGKEVYLIELTGGPSEVGVDYSYSFLTDHVYPAYISAVKENSSSSKVKYVGHSNGARVALDSLTAGLVNPSDVDTLVLVGVPNTLNQDSWTAEQIRKSKGSGTQGEYAISELIDKGTHHLTQKDFAKLISPVMVNTIGWIYIGNEVKISLNLIDYYTHLYLTRDTPSLGEGLIINKLGLFMGDKGIPFADTEGSDSAVNVADAVLINNTVTANYKNYEVFGVNHGDLLNNDFTCEAIKEVLE